MALDFAVGCLGGFSGILVGHPFDTVKVRLQSQDPKSIKYSGTLNCFAQIVKKESVYGLYKGMLSPLYGSVGINAIVFGIHGNILRSLGDHGVRSQFIAGAIAGGVQTLVCSPMELVKIRFQMQGEGESATKSQNIASKKNKKFVYSSPMDCLKKIYKHEGGVKGVFRGMTLTMFREIPSFGTYFASYHWLCEQTGAVSSDDISISKLLLCGGVAGMVCWVVTYPFDVIKTRQQMDGMGTVKYKGIIDCTMKCARDEGYGVFFRGLNATLLRAFPTNAATLATVTVTLNLLGRDKS